MRHLNLDHAIRPEVVDNLFALADCDAGGQIDYEEFKRVLTSADLLTANAVTAGADYISQRRQQAYHQRIAAQRERGRAQYVRGVDARERERAGAYDHSPKPMGRAAHGSPPEGTFRSARDERLAQRALERQQRSAGR